MIAQRDWLWDRNITLKKAKQILRNPRDLHFFSLAAILLSRKNTPKEVFSVYIKQLDFLSNWNRIKSRMRKDSWNNPRIEFWQAVYEKLREKYKRKGVIIPRDSKIIRNPDEFCRLIAGQIRSVRKQRGLTQAELARRLNVSQQVISRIEKGRENFSVLTLKRIVDGLGARIYLDIKTK